MVFSDSCNLRSFICLGNARLYFKRLFGYWHFEEIILMEVPVGCPFSFISWQPLDGESKQTRLTITYRYTVGELSLSHYGIHFFLEFISFIISFISISFLVFRYHLEVIYCVIQTSFLVSFRLHFCIYPCLGNHMTAPSDISTFSFPLIPSKQLIISYLPGSSFWFVRDGHLRKSFDSCNNKELPFLPWNVGRVTENYLNHYGITFLDSRPSLISSSWIDGSVWLGRKQTLKPVF